MHFRVAQMPSSNVDIISLLTLETTFGFDLRDLRGFLFFENLDEYL
jgi:hypothetical protein